MLPCDSNRHSSRVGMAPAPYTLRSCLESSFVRRGALVRQVFSRLNAGLCCARGGFAQKEEEEARFRGLPLALASELCVWNGFCLGELGLLLMELLNALGSLRHLLAHEHRTVDLERLLLLRKTPRRDSGPEQ